MSPEVLTALPIPTQHGPLTKNLSRAYRVREDDRNDCCR
jgi:hypothetical protein